MPLFKPTDFRVRPFDQVDLGSLYTLNFGVLDRAELAAREAAVWNRIGEELMLPIKQLVDFEGYVRKVMPVDAARMEKTVKGWSFSEITGYAIANPRALRGQPHFEEYSRVQSPADPSCRVDPFAGWSGFYLEYPPEAAAVDSGVDAVRREVVSPGQFYAVTGPEYLGAMNVRIELFSEPFRPVR